MIYFGQVLVNFLLLTGANLENISTETTERLSHKLSSSATKSQTCKTCETFGGMGGKCLDWVVVGGGIHGVHIGAQLAAKGINNFVIVDEEDELLFRWKRRAEATGMKFMRSSATFHLDVEKDALVKFAAEKYDCPTKRQPTEGMVGKKKKKTKSNKKKVLANHCLFANDYNRPSLDLFNRHCDYVISKYKLSQRHVKGKVQNINLADDVVSVTIDGPEVQTVDAKNVVLALGSDDPSLPSWTRQHSHKFPHLLDVATPPRHIDPSISPKLAIVGGGISAVHKALEIVNRKDGVSSDDLPMVHIISRHGLYEQQFDTHQEWMMDHDAVERSLKSGGSGIPQRQIDFRQIESYSERRKIIQKERRAGTVPASLSRQGLQAAINSKSIEWHVGDITKVTTDEDQQTILQLTTTDGNTETIVVDQVLLATGFGTKPPGADTIISQLVGASNLPLSPQCGYPIVDSTLRWSHPRLFVTGALAELELGPSARNLAGARMAAERILGDYS
mmetsp:Transcript_29941/g.72577  ORF Transcript_29941/g.72577 Transcript_29941/m.72577 type:complete len:504 (+) Transcript_29941:89-1600(+)